MVYDIQRRMAKESSANSSIHADRVYGVSEAARLLGLSPSSLRNLEHNGQLQCRRTPGGQRRFLGADLIRLAGASRSEPSRRASSAQPSTAVVAAERSARQAWLSGWISRAQRELPVDTPSDIRLRVGAKLEQALLQFGPDSDMSAVEQLVKSFVEQARLAAEEAKNRTQRLENKAQLLEYAQAHLRRTVNVLPKRIAGARGSPKRLHVRTTLRDQLQARLQKRLTGDESWSEVREWVDEFVASWRVRQTPERRMPLAMTLLAAGLTGAAGGAAAAALSKPEVRAKVKDRLSAVAAELAKRIRPSSPPTPSDAPPQQSSQPSAPASPPIVSPLRPVRPWPNAWRPPGAWRPPSKPSRPRTPPESTLPGPEQATERPP